MVSETLIDTQNKLANVRERNQTEKKERKEGDEVEKQTPATQLKGDESQQEDL